MNQQTGYDELLEDRVRQLRQIDEWVESIAAYATCVETRSQLIILDKKLSVLRNDIAKMIVDAQAESDAF